MSVSLPEKRKREKIVMNVSQCKYPVVREIADELGIEISENKNCENFNIYWMDSSVSIDRVHRLKGYQYINHFANMRSICRKIGLCRNTRKMKRYFPRSYNFCPKTWILPGDLTTFRRAQVNGKTFIVKPNAGCQGKGIILTNDKREVERYFDSVCQLYVDRPFLIEGYKFDLRCFVLILCIDPLKIYFYNDGLVRMCTSKWKTCEEAKKNGVSRIRYLRNSYMHLTNYAINKKNASFKQPVVEDGENGSKRDFNFLSRYLEQNGYNSHKVWRKIQHIIVKSILCALPELQETYKGCWNNHHLPYKRNKNYGCFEILGYDIMLDENLRPFLLELNHSPSFATDSKLDHRIKKGVIKEALRLIPIPPGERDGVTKQSKIDSQHRLKIVGTSARVKEKIASSALFRSSTNPHFLSSGSPRASSYQNNNNNNNNGNEEYQFGNFYRDKDEIESLSKHQEKRYLRNYVKIYPLESGEESNYFGSNISSEDLRLNRIYMRKYIKFIEKANELYERSNRKYGGTPIFNFSRAYRYYSGRFSGHMNGSSPKKKRRSQSSRSFRRFKWKGAIPPGLSVSGSSGNSSARHSQSTTHPYLRSGQRVRAGLTTAPLGMARADSGRVKRPTTKSSRSKNGNRTGGSRRIISGSGENGSTSTEPSKPSRSSSSLSQSATSPDLIKDVKMSRESHKRSGSDDTDMETSKNRRKDGKILSRSEFEYLMRTNNHQQIPSENAKKNGINPSKRSRNHQNNNIDQQQQQHVNPQINPLHTSTNGFYYYSNQQTNKVNRNSRKAKMYSARERRRLKRISDHLNNTSSLNNNNNDINGNKRKTKFSNFHNSFDPNTTIQERKKSLYNSYNQMSFDEILVNSDKLMNRFRKIVDDNQELLEIDSPSKKRNKKKKKKKKISYGNSHKPMYTITNFHSSGKRESKSKRRSSQIEVGMKLKKDTLAYERKSSKRRLKE